MKIRLHKLGLEVTRRCNLKCAHCMRGKAQNIDMPEEYVDKIIASDVDTIHSLIFSGGEPTLNPDLIISTIDKIIEGKIRVDEMAMVTNGQIFNRDLVEAFNRYNEHRNKLVKEELKQHHWRDPKLMDELIKDNMDDHVRITFSTDRFHHPISQQVKDAYHETAKGLRITEYGVKDEDIMHTGYATIGKDFIYHQVPMKYYQSGTGFSTFCTFYVTATGYLTSLGNGQYTDMDQNNYGHINTISFPKLLRDHGLPVLDSPKIEIEEEPTQYVLTPKSANVS